MTKKYKIAVVGSGTMGNGIAHVCAQSANETLLLDINDNQLQDAVSTIKNNLNRQLKKNIINQNEMNQILDNIQISSDLNMCKDFDLIIEAIPEKFELKSSLFKELDKICNKNTVFATNTSSISISNLANQTNRDTKFIGMHFMNPVPIMKLVEVINTLKTDSNTTNMIVDIIEGMNKVPIQCNDYPGFISNRILMPMINEAIFCLEQNVATKEAIDGIMKLGMAHPMGPLELADFIGLDVCLDIMEVLWSGFNDSKYRPCPLLKKMVSSGLLGKKTGKGFYKYD